MSNSVVEQQQISNEKVTLEVSQGFLLGSVLFEMYINDITSYTRSGGTYICADDTTLTSRNNQTHIVQNNFDAFVQYANDWFIVLT